MTLERPVRPRLIVTADDFGLSPQVDVGISEAYQRGIVRSTALIVNFPDAGDSVARLRKLEGLELGIHLNLTAGPPLLPRHQVQSLVTADGNFHDFTIFFARVALGQIDWGEVFSEWDAQLDRGLGLGCDFSFITSHQHLHMLPAAAKVAAKLARRHRIRAVRLTDFRFWDNSLPLRPKALAVAPFVSKVRQIFENEGIFHNDSVFEIPPGKHEGALTRLNSIMKRLDGGVHELICHPGYVDAILCERDPYVEGRVSELEVLVDTRLNEFVQTTRTELTTFRAAAELPRVSQKSPSPDSLKEAAHSSLQKTEPIHDTLKVSLAEERDNIEWDEYLEHHRDSFFCLTTAWRNVVVSAYGHRAFYLIAREGKTIRGVLPLFLIKSRLLGRILASSPYSSVGAVCSDNEMVTRALVDRAIELAREQNVAYLELKSVRKSGCKSLVCYPDYVNFGLQLESLEILWNTCLNRAVHKGVRKAERSGLTTERGHHCVDELYGVMAASMRRLGTPTHSRLFYQKILTSFGDRASIILIRQGTKAIAGGLTLRHGDQVSILHTGSLHDFLGFRPNNLLWWEIIKEAVSSGAASVDMGRSLSGGGTASFKESWGAVGQPICYEYFLGGRKTLPQVNQSNPRFAAVRWAWQRMPLPLTKWLGPRLISGIP